jgi:predicted methyltransferase
MKISFSNILLMAGLLMTSVSLTAQGSLERNPDNAARDQYRHPVQTLKFFNIDPQMDVVEISPGGGWYTEVLAKHLTGTLFAAHASPESKSAYYRNSQRKFVEMLEANQALYGNVEVHVFDAGARVLSTADNSADAVLTFRNVHNWMRRDNDASSFELFFKTLKPGGILGVVEHRAVPGTARDSMIKSGYVTQAHVIKLAEDAGFIFEASSEVNANPADTADHPRGVWTLPPNLRLGDVDRERYLAIGESDRMTLRFRKPSGD